MPRKEIPDSAIELVAKYINTRSNKNYGISVIGHEENIETPQIFEIIPFNQIDDSDRRFYAIDGSYNSEQFYNGLCIAMYAAGYICFYKGQQIRMNSLDDPVILGKAYYPQNILITNQEHLIAIYHELLILSPVQHLINFLKKKYKDNHPGKSLATEDIFSYKKEKICTNLSTLLGFCPD